MDERDQYDIEYNKVCVENEHPCKNSAKNTTNILWIKWINNYVVAITVKLGNKERFDKEQIGIKELFMDYQPFYTINLLLDKELLPI